MKKLIGKFTACKETAPVSDRSYSERTQHRKHTCNRKGEHDIHYCPVCKTRWRKA